MSCSSSECLECGHVMSHIYAFECENCGSTKLERDTDSDP